MIAPEPFFEPRGTPFSEFHRIRALTTLGHQVDLVTYPFGRDVTMRGLRVFRCLRPPFVQGVRVGPSLAKIPLDALLALTALRRALAGRYDAIHSHEEGGLIGVLLAAVLRVPHLYDMHSSLAQQLTNFSYSRSVFVRGVFQAIERIMIRRSRVVIVICPALEDTVRAIDPRAQVVLIENAPGSAEDEAAPADAAEKVMHADLRIGDTTVLASDGQGQGTLNFQGFSLSLTVATDSEADRLFAALSDGGRVQLPLTSTPFASRFGMVADRFGVLWTIAAQERAASAH